MTDRGASADFLTEAAKAANEPFSLFELQLDLADGGAVYATDCHRPVVFNGNTYVANGHLLTHSAITESAELRVRTCNVSLSGVDQSWIALMLTVNYLDRPLLIYKGFVAATTDTMVVDPVAIFDGRVDGVTMAENPEDGTCSVTLSVSDQMVTFDQRSGRHTNHLEQQLYFPTDTFFSRVSSITRTIKWGQS